MAGQDALLGPKLLPMLSQGDPLGRDLDGLLVQGGLSPDLPVGHGGDFLLEVEHCCSIVAELVPNLRKLALEKLLKLHDVEDSSEDG